MKKKIGLLLATLLVASTAAFAGCDMLGGNSSLEESTTSSVTTSSPADSSSVAPGTYTVTFNSDGGSEVAPATVEEGEKVTKPTDPTKTGYTFDGWYLGETAFDFENVAITTNVTLTAKWNVVTYTATVVKADSTEVEVEFTVENKTAKLAEIAAMLPEDTTEFDYEWATALPSELALNDTQEFIVEATKKTYTVSFDQGVTAQTIEYGAKATKPEDPTAPTNFRFDGWFEDGAQTAFDFENTTITGNVVLTAKFTQTHGVLTVTLYMEGADPQVLDTKPIELDTPVDLSSELDLEDIPAGYYFDEEASTITGTMGKDGLALSVYLTKYRTVTVNANGGTAANETLQVKKGATLPAIDVSKSGYEVATFINTADNTVVNNETVVNSDMTVKAIWKVAGVNYVLGSDVAVNNVSGSGSIVSISDKSHTDDGTGSIALLENGGWPGLNVTVSKTADEIKAFDYVTLMIYIDSDGGFREDGNKEVCFLGTTTLRIAPKTWTKIALSAADFASKLNESGSTQLFFLQNTGSDYDQGCVVYVDELIFANREYAADELDYCDTNESLANFTKDDWGSLGYSTEMSHDAGTGSIVRSSVNGWAHTYLKVSKTADEIKAFDYVSYWVYLDSDRQPDNIFLYGATQYSVATGEWVKVVRPASEFANNIVDGKVDLFWFEGEGRSKTITVYIDEIKLENRQYAADEIDYCDTNESLANFTKDDWGSLGYSTEMSHDAGTGSIVRSSVNGWAHTYLKVSKTADEIKAFDYVSYWVYLDSDRQPDNINLYGSVGFSIATGKWVEVVRPASEFADKIVDGKVDLFWFEGEGRSKMITVYIDEIKLVNVAEEVVDMCAVGVTGATYTTNDQLRNGGYSYEVTYDGNGSLYFYEWGSWPTGYMTFTTDQVAMLDKYENMTWYVYMDCAGGESLEYFHTKLDAAYKSILADKTWTKITVSTADIKANLGENNSFLIFYTNRKASGEKYYIDDIRFEGLKQA